MNVDKNSEMYKFFRRYFKHGDSMLPQDDEIVVAIYFNDKCCLCGEMGHGMPTTFAYYDHIDKEEWKDKSWVSPDDYPSLDFRDTCHNICCGGDKPIFFANKMDLSDLFRDFYELHGKHQEKLKNCKCS